MQNSGLQKMTSQAYAEHARMLRAVEMSKMRNEEQIDGI